ncbi:MAG: MBL fold metallo-hydrolase [Eubacterium sp.]|nr:MBL fold metallo-hydrolase [Eubacterium sp.]
MKLMNIASGSSGNCTYVGTDDAAVLVDAGISMKRVEAGLNSIDMTLKDIDGIFITHEHSDHIKGLKAISRKYEIPIYLTEGTAQALIYSSVTKDIDTDLFTVIDSDGSMELRDLIINSHSISHDAAEPVCYSFNYGNSKISIATDLGIYDRELIEFLSDSDIILLESNHDVRMLETGPYPYYLKRRILGNRGHLSNETSGKLLKELLNDHLKAVILGHLSRENNFPELAYETVRLEIADNPFTSDVRDFNLSVAKRDECDMIYYTNGNI